ncbi:MAG: hypothetical protein ATN36_01040 [Epulopiscium sp. Nele67-Bin005]|nr:MAG: hypothetical protein ATN36_01040 [Epulopiscium sp. Nele67-Bin005]
MVTEAMENQLLDFINDTSESFYKVDKSINKLKDLSDRARMIYMYLVDRFKLSLNNKEFKDAGGVFIIYGQEALGEMMGLCRQTVAKYLNELEKWGLIRKKRMGLTKANKMYFPVASMIEDRKAAEKPPVPKKDEQKLDTNAKEAEPMFKTITELRCYEYCKQVQHIYMPFTPVDDDVFDSIEENKDYSYLKDYEWPQEVEEAYTACTGRIKFELRIVMKEKLERLNGKWDLIILAVRLAIKHNRCDLQTLLGIVNDYLRQNVRNVTEARQTYCRLTNQHKRRKWRPTGPDIYFPGQYEAHIKYRQSLQN